jgi:hypothetical protein
MFEWFLDAITVVIIFMVLSTLLPPTWRRVIGAGLGWLGGGVVEVLLAMVGHDPAMTPQASQAPPPAARRQGYLPSRSARVRVRSSRSNIFSTHSAHSDAETNGVQRSRSAFSVQPRPAELAAHDPRMPQNADELQKLARAITIHAQAPRGAKQRGIAEAWGVQPGGGPDWERASALFDLAIPPKPRISRSPTADLEMQSAP